MQSNKSFPVPAGDDEFHADGSGDVWLTETAWYSFWTPGAELAVHVYLRFRHNVGIANSCIYAWKPGISTPWDAAYWKHLHVPIPESLTDLTLLGGIRHRQIDPYRTYEINYEDDTEFDGTFAFNVVFEAIESPQWFGGKHFDQSGVVRGKLESNGEVYEVDCRVMRDRSWYRRSDFALFRSAYSYVLGAQGDGFLALFAAPRDQPMLTDDLPLVGGWWAASTDARIPLVAGMRTVTRRDPATGAPLHVEIDAVDSAGRGVQMSGDTHNVLPITANANMMSWMSLTRWWMNDSRYPQIGEDQEIWSPSLWRSRHRIIDAETRSDEAGVESEPR